MELVYEVTAPDGKPVEGAEVLVMLHSSYNLEAQQDEILATGKTDADGRLKVTVPHRPGSGQRYGTVLARKKGVGVTGMLAVLFTAAGQEAEATRKVSLRLFPLAECRLHLLKPDGSPAAGVQVQVSDIAMPQDTRGFMFTPMYSVPHLPEVGWEARTDAEGRCVVSGLPHGASVYLRHDAEGLAQLPEKHDPYSAKSLRATGVEHERHLVKGGTVRGKIVTTDGTALPGCHLFLLEDLRPYTTAYGEQIVADAKGRFEFKQVPPSVYKIIYRVPGTEEENWIGDTKEGLKVDAGPAPLAPDLVLTRPGIVTAKVLDAETEKEIESPIIFFLKAGTHQLRYRSQRMGPPTHLPPGPNDAVPVQIEARERKEIAFRLRPKKANNTVTGVVLDVNGRPAPGAGVALMGDRSDGFVMPQSTDEKGAFSFTVSDPKNTLAVLAWTDKSLSEPTPVKAGSSTEVGLQTDGFASIRGVIRDEQGKPVAGASFQVVYDVLFDLIGGPVPQHSRVGPDGAFHIPRVPKAVKEVTLFAYAEGYGKATLRDHILKSAEALEWNPVLTAVRETIAGTVVDKAGSPVAGVQIRIYGDAQPSANKPVVTDAQGRFRVENLAAAPLRVVAQQRTDAISRNVTLSAKAPADDLRLVLPDAVAKVSGIVHDHRGNPVFGAEVTSYRYDRKTVTDKEGRFALGDMEQGWLTLRVKTVGKDGSEGEEEFRLKAGMQNVRLDLPAEASPEFSSAPPLDLTGKTAPEIHVGTWIHSDPLAAQAGGKVRILDFWGMECGPCLAGFPKVQKFWEKHGADGIEIIALGSPHYPKEEVQEYLQKHPDFTFPMAIQAKGAQDANAYQVRGVPTYVVIAKDGKILSSGHDWDEAATMALKAAQQ
jgi:5-hydroxyisourate hydrolase-like protein (transthyretin family)/thiol-disulfide isomerase/thioredoxin